jgi:hypothetical protein
MMQIKEYYVMFTKMLKKKGRKAQLKIQETAFMLLALIFLFALLFIFYSNYEVRQVYSAKNLALKERAISLLDKFVAMPEFSCLEGGCIDEDKLIAIRNLTTYGDLWRGVSRIQVVRIYPSKQIITVYQKGTPELTYSAFVPLCKTIYSEGYILQKCDLAKLLVSIEEVKMERK